MIAPDHPLQGLVSRLGALGVPTRRPILEEGLDEGTLVYARTLRNVTHLDVDALDRRLRALLAEHDAAARHVHHVMDFGEATPLDLDADATLDLQEMWDGVRPTLHVDPAEPLDASGLDALAALVRDYHDLIVRTVSAEILR